MVGSKIRQAPKQGQRVLVQELPASFATKLTQNGLYTEIKDTTTGAAVEVPTASIQLAQTILAAFLPEGGIARGIQPVVAEAAEAAQAPATELTPSAQTGAQPAVASESKAPVAAKATKPPKAVKAPAKPAPAKEAVAAPATPVRAAVPKAAPPKAASKQTATVSDDFADEPWFAALPDGFEAGKRIVLRKVRVAVDEKKQDKVVGLASENPKNPSLPAYSINIIGTKSSAGEFGVGFVLAVSETKFLIVAPQLGPKTSHRGIRPTAQRLEILLETSRDQALVAA